MRRLLLTLAFVASSWSGLATASAEWHQVGEGVARWMFMDIYQAKLYRPVGVSKQKALTDSLPLKLSLCYYKPISTDVLIQGANESLPHNLSPILQAEVDRLHASYESVKPNDCYELRYQNSVTELLLNQQLVFRSSLAEFKQVYFGIWLGDKPLSDKLKSALLSSQ